jgi:hypothetical protein
LKAASFNYVRAGSVAPAAVANAINDALAPLGASIETLPITQDALWRVIETAKAKTV